MNDQLKDILEQQLRDVQTPDAVSWWPLAIGWWIIIVLIVSSLTLCIVALMRRRRVNRYRTLALSKLTHHQHVWQTEKKDSDYLQAANAVLKRACLHFDNNASNLSGVAWITFLNARSTHPFSDSAQLALTQQLYHQNPNVDVGRLHEEIKTWLLEHSSEPSARVEHLKELTNA